MAHIEGGCLCGQVRFSGDAEPVFQAICHCKNCQKQAGTAYSVIVGVPRGALTVVTDGPYGTSSSSLIALPEFVPATLSEAPRRPIWLFAAGRPGEAPYEPVKI